MEKLSWEFLIYCYITSQSSDECQPEWKQMEISVMQASNDFVQSEQIVWLAPSDAGDLGRPYNSLFGF